MKTVLEYLDAYIEATGARSDAAASKALGLTRSAASNWRQGRALPDDYTCAAMAMAMNVDPLEVIAAANAEREKEPEKKEFWGNLLAARKATVAAMLIAASSSSISAPRIETSSIGRGYDVSLHDINIIRTKRPNRTAKRRFFYAL